MSGIVGPSVARLVAADAVGRARSVEVAGAAFAFQGRLFRSSEPTTRTVDRSIESCDLRPTSWDIPERWPRERRRRSLSRERLTGAPDSDE